MFRIKTKRNWLHRYGGIFERGSREYTLDDFYALHLDKVDRYICLKKSDVVIPTEGEEESSSDEDGEDDDEDEEDEEEDREGPSDDEPGSAQPEPVKAQEEVEAEGEDVSDPSSRISQGLIRGIGSTCYSYGVLGCVERRHPISGRRDQHPTSRRDVGDVLCEIS